MVVMKMRNQYCIDLAWCGVQHMCAEMHQAPDSWSQEWIGQQAGATHIDDGCRMSKEVNSRHDAYGSGGREELRTNSAAEKFSGRRRTCRSSGGLCEGIRGLQRDRFAGNRTVFGDLDLAAHTLESYLVNDHCKGRGDGNRQQRTRRAEQFGTHQ